MQDAEKFVWAGIGFMAAFIVFLIIGLLDQNGYLDPILNYIGLH